MTKTGKQSQILKSVFIRLAQKYNTHDWWPADSELEIVLGAILTQGTSWTNAAKAITNLKRESLLSVKSLTAIPLEQLAMLIKPSVYFNQKARKITAFIAFLQSRYNGNLDLFFTEDTKIIRINLLSIFGIGQETADDILLYAARRPIFVIDGYTRRIIDRLGLTPTSKHYLAYQKLFHDSLINDPTYFNQCHALLVLHAQDTCQSKPQCHKCCLIELCLTGLKNNSALPATQNAIDI